jgi:hypothetical protein
MVQPATLVTAPGEVLEAEAGRRMRLEAEAIREAKMGLKDCAAMILAGEKAEQRAVQIIKAYQKKVGKEKRHLIALANEVGVHVSTLYRWMEKWDTPYKVNAELLRAYKSVTARTSIPIRERDALEKFAENAIKENPQVNTYEIARDFRAQHPAKDTRDLPDFALLLKRMTVLQTMQGDGCENLFVTHMEEVLKKMKSPEWLAQHRFAVEFLSKVMRSVIKDLNGYANTLESTTCPALESRAERKTAA